MIIKLSKAEVEIADNITWGQQEKIKATMIGGISVNGVGASASVSAERLLDAKYMLLEMMIKRIIEDGKEIKYSKDWAYNLSQEDGEKLYSAVDDTSKKK